MCKLMQSVAGLWTSAKKQRNYFLTYKNCVYEFSKWNFWEGWIF